MTLRNVFVLSDMRSGSTLLDQLLGAHSSVMSLGEVHWLDAYVRQDRAIYDPEHDLVCTCGSSVVDCRFWGEVARRLARPLDTLQLRIRAPALVRRLFRSFPASLRVGFIRG